MIYLSLTDAANIYHKDQPEMIDLLSDNQYVAKSLRRMGVRISDPENLVAVLDDQTIKIFNRTAPSFCIAEYGPMVRAGRYMGHDFFVEK